MEKTGRPFNGREQQRIRELGLAERCQCRFIPSEDMATVYTNAECFVFPSKMEGFGMPVLESFDARCPVILSDASCFPEVAGKGGIFFNPDDPDELSRKIAMTINDRDFRNAMVNAGEKELSRFSWKKTGRQTAETYLKAINR